MITAYFKASVALVKSKALCFIVASQAAFAGSNNGKDVEFSRNQSALQILKDGAKNAKNKARLKRFENGITETEVYLRGLRCWRENPLVGL